MEFRKLTEKDPVGFVLDMNDKTADVYPDDNTLIRLYGEAHGANVL